MPSNRYRLFRTAWLSCNLLLVVAALFLLYSSAWEYSVRKYLQGFSDAVVPANTSADQKVEAILAWMRNGPPRTVAPNPEGLSKRNPEATLNYQQLLSVCGTATNAFLNLSRSAGLEVRRLLLLTPERTAKHVVAEVLIEERWVIVDPAFRVLLRDAQGRYLTRKDLQNPVVFAQATRAVPNYPPEYDYSRFAHVRVARIPLEGLHLRRLLDRIYPGWDEKLDWSLLLERESFFFLVASAAATLFFFLMRVALARYADRRLPIPRFRFREHFLRAGAAFFTTPEIK